MRKPLFLGPGVAVVTPFLLDGEIDYFHFVNLVGELQGDGAKALALCSSTGESELLSTREKIKLIGIGAHLAPHLPILCGASGCNTSRLIEECILLYKAGAEAFLVTPPYYVRPTFDGILGHYTAFADKVQAPIIIYNVPSRTGIDLSVEQICQLAQATGAIGLKDCNADPSRIMQIKGKLGEEFAVYCGEDSLLLPYLYAGASGAISAAGNVMCKTLVQICTSFANGDYSAATERYRVYYSACKALFSKPNPVLVKGVLADQDKICRGYRLPMTICCDRKITQLIEQIEQA